MEWAVPPDTNTQYTAGTGLNLSGTEFSVTSLALTTVQEASSESAQLSLTTQEGDVVVRTDENKSYVKNSNSSNSMSDFTLLRTPTDAVLSVNGNTGAITAAQIASAVEAASDSNTFTDADHTKLDGIEASATADQTGAEIKTAYEAESDTNAYTDAEKTKLAGIETSATADQTDAEIRTAVEAATDSNVFTDADHTKLNAIEASATADQTGAEIKTAYEAEADTNAFTDTLKTKLDGIATGAEVNTDTTYSISCVDGDNTDEEKIRLTAGGDGSGTDDVVLEAGTGLSIARSGDKITFTNTVTDTNTQLTTEEVQDIIGGMVSGNTETNIAVTYDDTNGKLNFVSTDTNTTYSIQDGQLSQNNFTDALKTKLDGIAASANNYSISSDLLDEDNMASDSATKVASQQSIKAYVDANTGTTDLSYTASSRELASSTGTNVTLPEATTSNAGLQSSSDKSKLDGIAANATVYADSNVNTHLNTSSASNNQVLGWNGSDYSWVDQTGGETKILETPQTISQNLTLTSNKNALSVGSEVAVANTYNVTVPSGSSWSISQ